MFQGTSRGEDTGTINLSNTKPYQLVVDRYRVGKDLGSWGFGFNGIYKGPFKGYQHILKLIHRWDLENMEWI